MRTRKAQAKDPLWLRHGIWYARTTVRVGGKSLRLRETSGFREEERVKADIWVRRRISEIENELLFGPAPSASARPELPDFATAAADYAEAPRRAPLGNQDLNKLLTLGEFLGDTPVDQLGQHEWNGFVDERLVDPADETVRRWFAMFRAPIKRALEAQGLAFGGFELPPPGEGRSTFLEEDVADQLVALYAPHAAPIATLLRYQGCRIGEALRLRLPGDVSFRRETLHFRLTKNGEPRVVPMHDIVARALRAHVGERNTGPLFLTPEGLAYADRRQAALTGRHDGGGIRGAHRAALARYALGRVTARDGRRCRHCRVPTVDLPGHPDSARLQLVRPRARGGADELHNYAVACATCAGTPWRPARHPADTPRLNWFHVHDWRHHWASWFIMKGGRETELMRLGGWKDQRMIQRYVRLGVEHLRIAVNQV